MQYEGSMFTKRKFVHRTLLVIFINPEDEAVFRLFCLNYQLIILHVVEHDSED